MTSEASDLSEFWGLQWLIDRGVEGARERQDALLDRRATESVTERAAFESAFEDAPVWPTPIAVPGPSAVRAAYEAAPVILVDTRSGQITGVRHVGPPEERR